LLTHTAAVERLNELARQLEMGSRNYANRLKVWRREGERRLPRSLITHCRGRKVNQQI